jgi:hypothetical protein
MGESQRVGRVGDLGVDPREIRAEESIGISFGDLKRLNLRPKTPLLTYENPGHLNPMSLASR